MTFKKKIIELQITLTDGTFSNGHNTKIIRGLRTKVNISNAGTPSRPNAKVIVYGISQEDMQAMTFLAFRQLKVKKNLIVIKAGNDGEELDETFRGEITIAAPVFTSAPDVYFEIEAISGNFANIKPMKAYSFTGVIPIETMVSDICKEIDYVLINNGVTQTAKNPYYKGSGLQKIIKIAKDYKFSVVITGNTITISPLNKPGEVAAYVSKETGLIGYPTFSKNGIKFSSQYLVNTDIKSLVQLQSIIPNATGIWEVISISHDLETETPNGKWNSDVEASWYKEAQ